MIFKFLLLVAVVGAQTLPSNMKSVTSEVNLATSLSGNQLTVHVQKNRKGHFAFGFGRNMDAGDVFIIEANPTMTIRTCRLVGEKQPACSGTLWVLAESTLNADGTWKARVTRDISLTNSYTINTGNNNMIYSYSDSLGLEDGHSSSTNRKGVFAWSLGNSTTATSSAGRAAALLSVLAIVMTMFA